MARKYTWSAEGLEKQRERMRKLNADPEFAKANAERMREIWRKAKAAS